MRRRSQKADPGSYWETRERGWAYYACFCLVLVFFAVVLYLMIDIYLEILG
ncbi:MAG: hypothetical protein ACFFCK_03980 [Promethearchaeota archaeon]